MTGFEPQTSGIGSDRSTNWVTTPALKWLNSFIQLWASVLYRIGPLVPMATTEEFCQLEFQIRSEFNDEEILTELINNLICKRQSSRGTNFSFRIPNNVLNELLLSNYHIKISNSTDHVAPWLHLRLTSYGPGFKYQQHHLRFFQFILLKLYLCLLLEC